MLPLLHRLRIRSDVNKKGTKAIVASTDLPVQRNGGAPRVGGGCPGLGGDGLGTTIDQSRRAMTEEEEEEEEEARRRRSTVRARAAVVVVDSTSTRR